MLLAHVVLNNFAQERALDLSPLPRRCLHRWMVQSNGVVCPTGSFSMSCLWLPQFSLSLSNCLVIPCHPHPTNTHISRAGWLQVSRNQPIYFSSGAEVTQVKMKKLLKKQFQDKKSCFRLRDAWGVFPP